MKSKEQIEKLVKDLTERLETTTKQLGQAQDSITQLSQARLILIGQIDALKSVMEEEDNA